MTLTMEKPTKARSSKRRVPCFEIPPSLTSQDDKERLLTNDEIIELVKGLKAQWDAASIRAGLRKGARDDGTRPQK